MINHYALGPDETHPIFAKLTKAELFSGSGVFRSVWNDPRRYNRHGCHVVVKSLNGKPISVAFAAKDAFYGWREMESRALRDCYGMLGFYTDPEHRQKGLARSLCKTLVRDTVEIFGVMGGARQVVPPKHADRFVKIS